MKKIKIIILAAGAFLFLNTNAQDIKPVKGDNQLELQINPGAIFQAVAPVALRDGGIQYRMFMSDNTAFRLNFNVGMNNSTKITQQADNAVTPTLPELKDKTTNMTIGLAPGIEKHFKGTDRLSPYVGAVLNFSVITYKDAVDKDMLNTGGTAMVVYTETTKGYTAASTNAGLNISLGAVAGFDYYIAKHLYLGAEMGFALVNYTSLAKTKFSTTQAGATATPDVKNGSNFALGPQIGLGGCLRLGFTL